MRKLFQRLTAGQITLGLCAALLFAWSALRFWLEESALRIPLCAALTALGFLLCLAGLTADRRQKVCGLVFGAVYMLATVLGHEVYADNDISSLYATAGDLAQCLLGGAGAAVVIGLGTAALFRALAGLDHAPAKPCWRIFRTRWAIVWIPAALFLCWLPWYLALYPGVFSYDIQLQAWQVTHQAYSL